MRQDSVKRYNDSKRGRASKQRYRQSAKGRAAAKRYRDKQRAASIHAQAQEQARLREELPRDILEDGTIQPKMISEWEKDT